MHPDLEQLNELLRRADEYKISTPIVFCRNCGATNMPGDVECVECGEAFPCELTEAA